MVLSFDFGVNLSTSIQKVTNEITNENNSETYNELRNRVNSQNSIKIVVESGGTFSCAGSLKISNKAKTEISQVLSVQKDTEVDFSTEVIEDLLNAAKAEQTQEQTGLSIGDATFGVNAATSIQENKDKLTNIISNVISSVQISDVDSGNQIEIIVGKKASLIVDGNCEFENDQITQAIQSNFQKLLEETKSDTKLDKKVKNIADAEQTQVQGSPWIIIAIIACGSIFGFGGIGSAAYGSNKTKGIVGFFLLILGICGIIGSFYINTKECEDEEPPTNEKQCIDGKDEDDKKIKDDDIPDCKCEDKSEYEERRWTNWLFLLAFISSCVFGLIGIGLLIYVFLSDSPETTSLENTDSSSGESLQTQLGGKCIKNGYYYRK